MAAKLRALSVAFRIIWRSVSELIGVMSWHARAERSVRSSSRCRVFADSAHLEKNRPLHLVAADGKLPFRTAQRWVSQYRKFGLVVVFQNYSA